MKRGNLGSHRRLREWLSTRGHHRTRNRSWKKPGFKENPSPLTFVFCAALSPHQGDTRSPPPSSCHLVQPLKTPQFLTCPISVTIPVSLHWFLSCPGFAATFLCPQGKGSGRDIVTWDDGKVPPHPSGLELYKNHPPCRPCFGEIQGENTPNKEQTKKFPLTKSILALQVSSKHFLSVNPNLSRFQLLFGGLLYQEHQKWFGSSRSPNSSSRWILESWDMAKSRLAGAK